MMFFRHHSLKRDLITIIMAISLLSILLTSLSISYIQYISIKDQLAEDLQVAARTVIYQNQELVPHSAVANVQHKIFANLSVFLNNPTIDLICVYDKNKKLIAFYDAADHAINDKAASDQIDRQMLMQAARDLLKQYEQECPISPLEYEQLVEDVDYLALHAPLFARNAKRPSAEAEAPSSEAVGSLYLVASLNQVTRQIQQQLLTTLVVCAGSLLVSYLLAVRLQRGISNPVQLLTEATRSVTVYKDYSVRVEKNRDKYSTEINELIEHFNHMLKEIGDRDSKLMRKNIELERAKEMAESANMSKSQFLANISHELRTPLNAIIGFSSIIVNQLFGPIGNDKYADYGRDINESGIHLLDIINDILDLSKAEAGKLRIKLESFNVKEAIQKCLQIVSERAAEGNVSISTNIPADLPELIADRVRFIQIMLNILSNAVKFTESGGHVDITVECEKAGNEVYYFTFIIKDNGIGMRKSDIDMAFEAFGQVDSGLNRRFEGTGLGLPLTKKLVELHNGSIRIDSQLHHGTTVSIRFISDKALLT